jgi:hypothetical protein
MVNKYPNSGLLNTNSYKNSEKQPDFKGSIKMNRTVLKQLMMETTEEDIEIKLSAWNMQGSRGPFMRLAWDSYKKPDQPKPQLPTTAVEPEDTEDLPF